MVAFCIVLWDVLICRLLKFEWYFSNYSSSSMCQVQGNVWCHAEFCSQHTVILNYTTVLKVFSQSRNSKATEWKVDYNISSFIRIWILNFNIPEAQTPSYADAASIRAASRNDAHNLGSFCHQTVARSLLDVENLSCEQTPSSKVIKESTVQRFIRLFSLQPTMPLACLIPHAGRWNDSCTFTCFSQLGRRSLLGLLYNTFSGN